MRAWIRVELPVAIAEKSWIRVLDTPSCYERAVPLRGRIESPCSFAFTMRLIGQKVRAVCTIAQLPELRHGHPWKPDRTVLSFEILSLRAESWSLFVRQTSDLFDKESF